MDELNALLGILSDSVSRINESCIRRNVDLPGLDVPFSVESERPRLDPDIEQASSLAVAAATQLIALVRPTAASAMEKALQFHVSSAMRVAIETHTAEILRDAGPQGLHVNDIATLNGTEPTKLGRVLRILATEHIFKELAPDVFANNRISSVLDSGKDVKDLLEHPKEKHTGTAGLPALLEHFTDDAFKSSAYLAETFTGRELAKSDAPNHTAFNVAQNTKLTFFPWLELPENEKLLRRFGLAMRGSRSIDPGDVILEAFNWASLKKDTVVVDVGGGIGSQSLPIARTFPDLKVVVLDRHATVFEGIEFWKTEMPSALTSGQVEFKGHDFFEEPPVKGAGVYFMRMILHDWADSYCIEILKNIRAVAASDTRLLIIDRIISYASADTTVAKDVSGGLGFAPPEPLLPNGGHAAIMGYLADISMMAMLNGQERTLAQLDRILAASGWKLVEVRRPANVTAVHYPVIAAPALQVV